mgnify:FL=1
MYTTEDLVAHPNWKWEKGMLAHPYYKTTQQVRIIDTKGESWLPVLTDPSTISVMCMMIIESGGSVKKEQEFYVINDHIRSESLQEIICEGLITTWENQSSLSKNS